MKDLNIKQSILEDKIVFKVVSFSKKLVKNIIIDENLDIKIYNVEWRSTHGKDN